jgi:hypothetical protein
MAVEKGMQRCQVVVQRECLDERVMLVEDRAHGIGKLAQRLDTLIPTLRAPVTRRAEGDVLIAATEVDREGSSRRRTL